LNIPSLQGISPFSLEHLSLPYAPIPIRTLHPNACDRGARLKNWLHEIKHDGYRLIVQREGKRVRLFTRNGYDWSDRYPLITEAALRNRNTSFVIDGEAVLLGVDGLSDFAGLHSREHDDEVQFYAFDCLVSDGEDIRKLPLTMRKTNLSRLLGASMASFCLTSNMARSGQTYSAMPASSALKGWFQSTGTGLTEAAALGEGQKSHHPAMSRVHDWMTDDNFDSYVHKWTDFHVHSGF